MRVLFLSPFSPIEDHQHAAAFTLAKIIPKLADLTDLTVFAPKRSESSSPKEVNYRLLQPPAFSDRNHRIGRLPGWLRKEWPAQFNSQVDSLVTDLRPDVIHAEYLQTAEVAFRWPQVVLGLPDQTASVMRKSIAHSRGLKKVYRAVEFRRTRAFELEAAAQAAGIVALSEADGEFFSQLNPRTRVIPPGVDLPVETWSPPGNDPSVLVFTGAMWRRANGLIADMLVKQVMPRVWTQKPDVVLRIVGAGPDASTRALARSDDRVVVTGNVPDLDREMLNADGVLAPTILGGGVLIKVLRALALGCPTVTSETAAASVGATASEALIADDPRDIASSALALLKAPAEARAMGHRGRTLIANDFAWGKVTAEYLRLYEDVAAK